MQDFYQSKAYLQCASALVDVPFNPSIDIYNDGWQTTLDLISKQAAAMAS
jgi:mannan endo-1,4-beta-mannosidase